MFNAPGHFFFLPVQCCQHTPCKYLRWRCTYGEVRQIRIEARGISDAPEEARHVEEWTVRPSGHEPQAGDRYRIE